MAFIPTPEEIEEFRKTHGSLFSKPVPTDSQGQFNAWRDANAPELPDSAIAYFQPEQSATTQESPVTPAVQTTEESHGRRHNQAHGSDEHEGKQDLTAPNAQSLNEDSRYQNIVHGHIRELQAQNPDVKIDGKVFVTDETGATRLNEDVLRQIKTADPSFDLEKKANDTFSTAFGNEAVEQYEKKGQLRTYKHPVQDPAYRKLQQQIHDDPGNADEHYRKFFAENPARAAYGEQDMVLKRAHRQYAREQQEHREAQEKATGEQAKIRRTVFRDPRGRPSLDHDPEYRDTRSRIETRIHEETSRLTGAGQPVDQDGLRRRITQEEHEQFIKSQTREKIDRYTKYHPELAEAREEMLQREKQERSLYGTGNDPRIKKLHDSIQEEADREQERQRSTNDDSQPPSPREQIEARQKAKAYERTVRQNPELAREMAKTDPAMQKAINDVRNGQNMAAGKEPGKIRKRWKKTRLSKWYNKQQTRYKDARKKTAEWTKNSRGGRAVSWANNKLRNNIFTRTTKRFAEYRKGRLGKWLGNRRTVKAYRSLQENINNQYHAFKTRFGEWFKNTRLGRAVQKITAPFRKLKNKFTNNIFTRAFRSGRDAIDDTKQLIKNYFKGVAKKALRRTFGRAFQGLSKIGGRLLGALGKGAGRTGGKAASQLGRGLTRVGGKVGKALTRAAVRIAVQTMARVAALASLVSAKAIIIGAIIIIVLLFLIFITFLIICIIIGCKSGTPQVKIEKFGPSAVPNPDPSSSDAANITYDIKVSYPGSADKIVVTDKLDDKVEFVNADGPIQGKYDPTTHTVTWEILPSGGGGSPTGDIAKLLPNPLPADPSGIEGTKNPIVQHFKDNPELIQHYKGASAKEGIPWQVYAGLHWREGDALPGYSLTSGRKIGDYEPDPDRGGDCDGTPGAVDGRPDTECKFADAVDDIMYASRHLEGKISKKPSTHEEIVEAMARYNGYPGRSNCHHGTPYPHCPPLFPGEDNSYVFTFFDERHAVMYEIYCGDGSLCGNNLKAGRPGALTVTKWVAENIQ